MERQSSIEDFFKPQGEGKSGDGKKRGASSSTAQSTGSKAGTKRRKREPQPSASASIDSAAIPTVPLEQAFEGDALERLVSLGGATPTFIYFFTRINNCIFIFIVKIYFYYL